MGESAELGLWVTGKTALRTNDPEETIMGSFDFVEQGGLCAFLVDAPSDCCHLQVRINLLVYICKVSILSQSLDEGSEVQMRLAQRKMPSCRCRVERLPK
jgi:hypothetical protein